MKVEIAPEHAFWISFYEIKVSAIPPVGSVVPTGDGLSIVKWHYYPGKKDWRGRLICRLVCEAIKQTDPKNPPPAHKPVNSGRKSYWETESSVQKMYR